MGYSVTHFPVINTPRTLSMESWPLVWYLYPIPASWLYLIFPGLAPNCVRIAKLLLDWDDQWARMESLWFMFQWTRTFIPVPCYHRPCLSPSKQSRYLSSSTITPSWMLWLSSVNRICCQYVQHELVLSSWLIHLVPPMGNQWTFSHENSWFHYTAGLEIHWRPFYTPFQNPTGSYAIPPPLLWSLYRYTFQWHNYCTWK